MDSPEQILREAGGEVVAGGRDSVSFLRGAFSDGGVPSSSRILTSALGFVVVAVIMGLLYHICHLKDNVALGLWLPNLPLIITALVGLMAAPYTINRGTATITDILSSMRR